MQVRPDRNNNGHLSFAWNPSLWTWPELPADIRQLQRRGHVDTEWNSGRVRNIEIGSRAFLVRVGVPPKGIFGAGYTLTAPRPAPALAAGEGRHRRDDTTLDAAPRIAASRCRSSLTTTWRMPPFGRFRWGVRSSGVRIPSTLADALEDLWEARARGCG